MRKVAFITDSTAFLPKEILEEYPVSQAPQVLIWGEETFRDGVDIQPDEFYMRLRNAEVMPTSSQVPVKEFQERFRKLLDEGYDILALVLSEKLSGTLASAIQAKEDLPEDRIVLIDSKTTSMAMGFLLLEAMRAAQEGASLQECKDLILEKMDHVGVVFVVETLEFLHRGGRIGGASRWFGTALNIKPILEVTGGQVEAIERVRTFSKAIDRAIEIVEERMDGRTPVRLATIHVNSRPEAENLMEKAKAKFNPVETFITEVSPVVGTHAGPGTVGLAYIAG